MRYPIGNQDFRVIRTDGAVYVDKTEHIARVLDSGRYFFLSRPRRFGKSLTVSTIKEMYSGSAELFGGLWAAEHWGFAERQRPVIWLDFSNIGYQYGGLHAAIVRMLAEQEGIHGVEGPETDNVPVRFRRLLRAVAAQHPSGKVVLLVDEYDKPIVDYIEDTAKAVAHRDELKAFYSVLKSAEPIIELVFITGVSAFSKVSLFSDLNNLKNLTMHPLADTLVGITQVELDETFGRRIAELPYPRETIRDWYNGYSWGREPKVYNPWSILNFLESGVLDNHWIHTGTPTLLTKLLREGGDYDLAGSSASSASLTSLSLDRLTPLQLMFQSGYLTVRAPDEVAGSYVLDYPNKEVKQSFLDVLLASYSFSDSIRAGERIVKIKKALRAGDLASVVEILNAHFAGIPYPAWERQTEGFYHGIVHTLFTLLGVDFRSEVATSRGRADAIIQIGDYVYAFEFKLDRSAEEALLQIEDKGYLEPYADSGKQLVAVGINFSSKDKRVGEWVSNPPA